MMNTFGMKKDAENMQMETLPQFKKLVEDALTRFLKQYQNHLPNDLYALTIGAIEEPLLRLVMQHADYNQSKAAKLLGINRATLRKKLQEHHING